MKYIEGVWIDEQYEHLFFPVRVEAPTDSSLLENIRRPDASWAGRYHIVDDRPSRRVDCSLAQTAPPWQWTWSEFVPFSDMLPCDMFVGVSSWVEP
jgi:hypothetical protein